MSLITRLSAFQLGIYREVVAEHAVSTEHTEFCCGIAANYAKVLERQPVGAPDNTERIEEIARTAGDSSARYTKGPAPMASEKQISYLRSLLGSRQCSDVERAAWTLMLENGMEKKQASSIIERLLKRAETLSVNRAYVSTPVRSASEKQVDFIKGLLEERIWGGKVDFDTLTAGQASDLISELLEAKVQAKVQAKVDEGVYLLNGLYVKVQRAIYGSGQLYTKAFDPETESWSRKQGLFGKLKPEHKITEAQAAAFGRLYGECVRCARTLTDEFSIANGFGRRCGEQMGF